MPFVRWCSPMCDRDDCKRPEHLYGLCHAHWRLVSEIERRFRKLTASPTGTRHAVQETCTEHSVQRLIEGVENFLRDPSQSIAAHSDKDLS